jgi:hypothetical protein
MLSSLVWSLLSPVGGCCLGTVTLYMSAGGGGHLLADKTLEERNSILSAAIGRSAAYVLCKYISGFLYVLPKLTLESTGGIQISVVPSLPQF